MILAGDIGGTKTRLGLFVDDAVTPIAARTYGTRELGSLPEMIASFLASVDVRPRRACLGVAAPIRDRRGLSDNLPWSVDAAELERELGLPAVMLVNDIVSNARGIAELDDGDFYALHPGVPGAAGTRAVVSAGTGLGEAALWWDGATHRPAASEGGSCSFAPRSELEVELYRFVAAERDHVSVGRVCSGPGLRTIYRFFAGGSEAPDPPAIAAAAEADRSSAASAAVDLFVSIYGARAGDVALSYMSTGGVYLGGGIAPKLLPRLLEGGFMQAFLAKGSLEKVLRRMPVRVILNADAALVGAAAFARDVCPVVSLHAA